MPRPRNSLVFVPLPAGLPLCPESFACIYRDNPGKVAAFLANGIYLDTTMAADGAALYALYESWFYAPRQPPPRWAAQYHRWARQLTKTTPKE